MSYSPLIAGGCRAVLLVSVLLPLLQSGQAGVHAACGRGSPCLLSGTSPHLGQAAVRGHAPTSPGRSSPEVAGVASLVAGTYFNVRVAPTVAARGVGRIANGDKVVVLGGVQGTAVAGNPIWYKVRLKGGQEGYVSSSAFDALTLLPFPWVGMLTTDGQDGVTFVNSFTDDQAAMPYAGYALGTALTVVGVAHGATLVSGNDIWYRVQAAAEHPVFVYSAYLKYLHPGQSNAIPLPLLSAGSALLKDLDTGRILYANDAATPRPPASLVKMMTALLAVQRLGLEQVITVPVGAPSVGLEVGGTAMGLTPGERLTVRELLYGMLLPSGNDAAYTLAQAMGGSQAGFATLMNARARALGLRHTRFQQGIGLDQSGQYSTAEDLAMLATLVLRVPALARIVRTPTYTIAATATHAAYILRDTNQLLGVYPGVYGVKTGTTPAAGQCLVAALRTPGGHHVLAVVLDSADRYADARVLLDYATARER